MLSADYVLRFMLRDVDDEWCGNISLHLKYLEVTACITLILRKRMGQMKFVLKMQMRRTILILKMQMGQLTPHEDATLQHYQIATFFSHENTEF